jgi:phage terminase small subunit
MQKGKDEKTQKKLYKTLTMSKDINGVVQIERLKKDKFVDAYKKTNGNITDSASIAGISRGTYYNWLEKDEKFAMQILDSEADLNDEIRQVLISKAADGDMTAVIFYLKNRLPDFKQHLNTAIQINFNKVLNNERKEFEL